MPGYAQIADEELAEDGEDKRMWGLGWAGPSAVRRRGREAAAKRWPPASEHSPIASAPAIAPPAGSWLLGELQRCSGCAPTVRARRRPGGLPRPRLWGALGAALPEPGPTLTPVVDEMGYDTIVFDDTSELELRSPRAADPEMTGEPDRKRSGPSTCRNGSARCGGSSGGRELFAPGRPRHTEAGPRRGGGRAVILPAPPGMMTV